MKKAVRKPGHLLAEWEEVVKRIGAHPRVVVFLDFDGTMVDIAPRPDLVKFRPAARAVLQRLVRNPNAKVVMISGRRRKELLHHVGIRGIQYFGLYGWEHSARSSMPGSVRNALDSARGKLDVQLRPYPSVWVENKRSSLSIHLLDAQAGIKSIVKRKLRVTLKAFQRELRIVENIRDVEVLPRSFPSKGDTVRRILSQPAFRGAFPIYFGDDFSDESGFAAVRSGTSVLVGQMRATHARYRLRTPAEAATALGKIEATLADKKGRKPRRKTGKALAVAI
jgi:trehalose 6-phosphate phosphatase